VRAAVWVTCAHPDCFRGIYADPHHIANICAAGGWYCGSHNAPEDDR
jgi:hypothetical protein